MVPRAVAVYLTPVVAAADARTLTAFDCEYLLRRDPGPDPPARSAPSSMSPTQALRALTEPQRGAGGYPDGAASRRSCALSTLPIAFRGRASTNA
jgi:hypothetical protein